MNNKLRAILYCIAVCVFVTGSFAKSYGQADSLLHAGVTDSAYESQMFLAQSRRELDSGKIIQAKASAEQSYLIAFRNNNSQGQVDALMLSGKINFKAGNSAEALFSFWQTIKLKSKLKDKGFSERIYYNMAVTFASMKQYPMALKYFQKATLAKEKKIQRKANTSIQSFGYAAADTTSESLADTAFVDTNKRVSWSDDPIHLIDDKALVIDADTLYIHHKAAERKEQKVTEAAIIHAFDDGKQAVAYGLVIHAKQPVSGKRKTYTGISNVGHMFITLIKYNADADYTSRTFGFYPDKDNFLSATPLIPTSTSTFKDDEQHEWDEIVAKFIPRKTFNRILRMVKKYSKTKYNLNKNNCTDFGLCIASVAGIQIKDTHGSWPLGSGNNPGFAGQSISDDKVIDIDQDDLLIIDAMKDNLH
jgi:hypothetical protein